MKIKKLVVSMYAAGVMVSTLACATNGDTMMAVGSENTALGGTGVAHYVGAESTLANPAMLGLSAGRELVGGIVLFKPDVTNNGMGGTTADSAANTSYIPDVSYSSRINDHWTYGFAMAGIAGMGVDYTGAPASSNTLKAKTELSILKIIPTIAYNDTNFGLGFSPVLQYGSLAMSFDARSGGGQNINPYQNATGDTRLGFAMGGYFKPVPALTMAAAYNSRIKMNYGPQISYAAQYGFGQTYSDNLTQPAEIKVGVSYDINSSFTVTADLRQIQWANAQDYGDLAWKNQNVTAVGIKYKADGYWLGAGYNNSNNPIGVFANGGSSTTGQNGIGNMFNNLMFPGIIKSSYTLGGGYTLNKNYELAGSFMYAPKVTSTVDISDAIHAPAGSLFNTTTHSQQSYSVSLRYKF